MPDAKIRMSSDRAHEVGVGAHVHSPGGSTRTAMTAAAGAVGDPRSALWGPAVPSNNAPADHLALA